MGRVADAGGVVKERFKSDGGIPSAGGVASERIRTNGRVEVAGTIVRHRVKTDGLRSRHMTGNVIDEENLLRSDSRQFRGSEKYLGIGLHRADLVT